MCVLLVISRGDLSVLRSSDLGPEVLNAILSSSLGLTCGLGRTGPLTHWNEVLTSHHLSGLPSAGALVMCYCSQKINRMVIVLMLWSGNWSLAQQDRLRV